MEGGATVRKIGLKLLYVGLVFGGFLAWEYYLSYDDDRCAPSTDALNMPEVCPEMYKGLNLKE